MERGSAAFTAPCQHKHHHTSRQPMLASPAMPAQNMALAGPCGLTCLSVQTPGRACHSRRHLPRAACRKGPAWEGGINKQSKSHYPACHAHWCILPLAAAQCSISSGHWRLRIPRHPGPKRSIVQPHKVCLLRLTWSSTMTWHVEHARLPSQAPSSSTPFSCATSRRLLPSGACTVVSLPSFSSLNVTLMLQGGVGKKRGLSMLPRQIEQRAREGLGRGY